MRPLQSIAMGLVVIGLNAQLPGGYDALPDPLGWVLVLAGVAGLGPDLAHRSALLGLATLAALVSVPLWLPDLDERLHEIDPALPWAANLPQLGFAVLLCHTLATAAAQGEDGRATAWLRTAMTAFVVVTVLPVLVFGAGLDALEVPTYVAASLAIVLLVWLLFSYASRPWLPSQTPPRRLHAT
jgi:hypothetical protein